MFAPCPPSGGIITLKIGAVVPSIPLAARSKVPKVYPDPPLEIVTLSTFASLLIVTVASAPDPSPLIGI